MNGSLAAGNCSDISYAGNFTTCTQPTTSVLFDGDTPTLTELDRDMWASQLLALTTMSEDQTKIPLTFGFGDTPGYTGVGAVEVTMFNCPGWGLAVHYRIAGEKAFSAVVNYPAAPVLLW